MDTFILYSYLSTYTVNKIEVLKTYGFKTLFEDLRLQKHQSDYRHGGETIIK